MKKVDILLSVYNPNISYLRKQLQSLNVQTYANLELIVFDDCVTKRCDITVFEECITAFPWRILPYEDTNLGYTKAFEKLTMASDGDYVAFCDQDDIWMHDKIQKCVEELERNQTLVVATDRKIIDESDQVTCESVRKVSSKPYENWKTFDDIGKYNIFITYAVGMCMVINGELARASIPFSSNTGHDKWIIACACAQGRVSFIEQPLVMYRRHGGNVSGTLKGINCKNDYVKFRVLESLAIINDFENRFPNDKSLYEIKAFANGRKDRKFWTIFKYRYLAPDVAKFDLALFFIPDFLFKPLIKMARSLNDRIIT